MAQISSAVLVCAKGLGYGQVRVADETGWLSSRLAAAICWGWRSPGGIRARGTASARFSPNSSRRVSGGWC
jgi:hypothetical protein